MDTKKSNIVFHFLTKAKYDLENVVKIVVNRFSGHLRKNYYQGTIIARIEAYYIYVWKWKTVSDFFALEEQNDFY